MTASVVIPARLGSTRFPAKILAADTGKPLVQHVVDRVRRCRRVRQIVVAVDDHRIVAALEPFGTTCVMTRLNHASGTDRIAEVANSLDDQFIINVQGDEPEIDPAIVDRLIDHLETSGDDMATAATAFPVNADPADPNLVKVVVGEDNQALYFSRSPIPFVREPILGEPPPYQLHLGIYGYRRTFLLQFAAWRPTRLEQLEKLEQLRALEHGVRLAVLTVDRATHGIDTAGQYADFVARVRKETIL